MTRNRDRRSLSSRRSGEAARGEKRGKRSGVLAAGLTRCAICRYAAWISEGTSFHQPKYQTQESRVRKQTHNDSSVGTQPAPGPQKPLPLPPSDPTTPLRLLDPVRPGSHRSPPVVRTRARVRVRLRVRFPRPLTSLRPALRCSGQTVRGTCTHARTHMRAAAARAVQLI